MLVLVALFVAAASHAQITAAPAHPIAALYPRQTVDPFALPESCSSIFTKLSPAPTMPPDLQNYIIGAGLSAIGACGIVVPNSLSSEYSEYKSEALSWQSANKNVISSCTEFGALASQYGALCTSTSGSQASSSEASQTGATSSATEDSNSASTDTSSGSSGKSGLSGGAIAGIAVGVVAAVAIIAGIALFFILRARRAKRAAAPAPAPAHQPPMEDKPYGYNNYYPQQGQYPQGQYPQGQYMPELMGNQTPVPVEMGGPHEAVHELPVTQPRS